MKHIVPTSLFTVAMAFGLAVTPALAQNPNYAPGDLVLFFQQEGGTNTVYANLGNAATVFRGTAAGPDKANSVNFLDISATLVSAFGANWATDPTVYAGVAGVYETDNTNTFTVVNGDPYRTLYVSAARNSVGTVGQPDSAGYTVNTNTGMTNGANNIFNQNNILETNYVNAVVSSPAGTSRIDDQNPFFAPGLQDTAFGIFGGGVQQQGRVGSFGTFGDAGTVKFALDLYRILAVTTAPGQVAGVARQGSYEGTITVKPNGKVSFIAQGTATPFQTWALTFPALDSAAKRLPTADPDNDGMTNLMEFVLNGNPGVADPSIAPKLTAAGSNAVFSFTRRDDSETGSTLLFQYGSDLLNWTNATIGTGSTVVGNATISVTQNATTDAITVTVPKSAFPSGKFFSRLKISQ